MHYSTIINLNVSEKDTEPAFKINFSIRDGEKIVFKFCMTVIHWTELALPSYENQKEKTFQGFC